MKYQKPLNETNEDAGYINADIINGIEGSQIGAKAIEHPMREIVNTITAAGIEPDEADLEQLKKAIKIISGNLPTPTLDNMLVGGEEGFLLKTPSEIKDLLEVADKDMDNITPLGINKINSWGMPDYVNKVAKGINTIHQAEVDGFIWFEFYLVGNISRFSSIFFDTNSDNLITPTANTVDIYWHFSNDGGSGVQSGMIPIPKGMYYKYEHGLRTKVYFIPLKGEV